MNIRRLTRIVGTAWLAGAAPWAGAGEPADGREIARVASAEQLCIRWLETRSEIEIEVYPQIVSIARRVIAEAFSNDLITPGATTTADVAWYIRHAEGVIRRGDVLHLCTDTQEMGYVLELDEQDAPPGSSQALAAGNRWQDLLTEPFRAGRTGNEILASVYTHPLGFLGHGPGPTIGMWDDQWVQIKLEQSALFDGERVRYLAGRQTRWHRVR
ncbi:MAG TPA: hypothetical protein VD788_05300 [Candidatus Polarisedimenticolaceae bacterium]|nr:hypothetical protein [Candidatus Polarisedimenticolaceae bacterium]